MIFKFFNAGEATEVGISLADQFAGEASPIRADKVSRKTSGSEFQEILARADREVRQLRLGFYKKAKFANSFKWRLLEKGVEPDVADEVTRSLILHLAQPAVTPGSSAPLPAAAAGQPDARKLNALLSSAARSYAEGNYVKAVALYREFIDLSPENSDALNNLGVALYCLGRYQEAEQCYRRAIEINPEFAGAFCNLADLLQADPREAEKCLRRALQINPKFVEARVNLGVSLASSGREREAKACLKKAQKAAPNNPQALLGLGQIARAEGRFADAELLVKRALKLKPKLPGAWAALNTTRKMTLADSGWLAGAEEIAGSGVSLWEESELRFAIGKYYDDVGNYGLAFQNYRRGNELLKSVAQPYDPQAHGAFADDMIRANNRQALTAIGDGGSASMKPIFVLGMARSGTSLTEQIIASHPAAKGASETEFWLDAARTHNAALRQGVLGEQTRKSLAEEYLRFISRRCPNATRVVDKTPLNSDYLGLIYSVFPNAQIIRMLRDPIDTGLSIYFQRFSTGMSFSMDLSDIANYFRVHQRLMSHWCAALPAGKILEVPYEELVTDQEAWTRKILDFLKLEWDPRCLSFNETQRSVGTASAWQVRQKIYTQSVQRWRHYEKFVGPLKGMAD